MAVTPWRDDIRKGKSLTVFATAKVTGEWKRAFDAAIATFNLLSTNNSLGVTLAVDKTAPDKTGDTGARVQVDLGNGQLEYEAMGQKFVAKDREGKPLKFDPFGIHGATHTLSVAYGSNPARMERAFVFVPATPMVHIGANARRRQAGFNIRHFIMVHEFVHACGLSNGEHNMPGLDADVFATFITADPGPIDKPQNDRMLLHSDGANSIFAPPMTLKKKVADLIRDNWK